MLGVGRMGPVVAAGGCPRAPTRRAHRPPGVSPQGSGADRARVRARGGPRRAPPEPAWVPGDATPDPQDWACVRHGRIRWTTEATMTPDGVGVGIDVAQATLVVAVHGGDPPWTVANTRGGLGRADRAAPPPGPNPDRAGRHGRPGAAGGGRAGRSRLAGGGGQSPPGARLRQGPGAAGARPMRSMPACWPTLPPRSTCPRVPCPAPPPGRCRPW